MKKIIVWNMIMCAMLFVGCRNKKADTQPTNNEELTTKMLELTDGSQLVWLKDNQGQKLNPRSLFSDADDELWNSLNMPNGLPATVSTFLLKTANDYILFDTGLGDMGGQTLTHLTQCGINPTDIKLIYLTHFHADHIAGLITGKTGSDEKVYPNAEIYASRIEYEAWMNDIANNALQKKIFALYQDRLHLFEFDDILPHNVLTINAVGHTPGHTAFRFNELLIIGDLMHGYALQKDHLEINSGYDMDKQASIASRIRLLEYSKQNNLIIAGMHLPEPGFVK